MMADAVGNGLSAGAELGDSRERYPGVGITGPPHGMLPAPNVTLSSAQLWWSGSGRGAQHLRYLLLLGKDRRLHSRIVVVDVARAVA